jgi:hypothetical protein
MVVGISLLLEAQTHGPSASEVLAVLRANWGSVQKAR